ncbi:ancestral locus [Nakaseomyces bracarensis]|uniref:Ancestral locus n=1 Tax=Nakaseomyces bracarensis TaxID=273131 RepID=A0ABR4P041_9SACH
MVSIYNQSIKETPQVLSKKTSQKHLNRSITISPPLKQDSFSPSWSTVHRSASLNYKFYSVTKDYTPKQNNQVIAPPKTPDNNKYNDALPIIDNHLHLTKGAIVQKISDLGNGYWYVKPVNQLISGLVPSSYLEENTQLNDTICSRPHTAKWNTSLIDLTPPTSPSTIVSKTFSKASISRKTSVTMDSPRSDRELVYIALITKCEVTEITRKENRLEYTLKIENSNGEKKVKHMFYSEFYKLHTKLMFSLSNEISLPKIPKPMPKYIQNEDDDETVRKQEFNTYLTNLIDVVYDIKSPLILQDILKEWIDGISPNSKPQSIKIKVLYQDDFYALKCTKNEIDNLKKLERLLTAKIRPLNDKSDLKMTAKLEGWYIVELTDESMYRMILARLNDIQRLALDVKL